MKMLFKSSIALLLAGLLWSGDVLAGLGNEYMRRATRQNLQRSELLTARTGFEPHTANTTGFRYLTNKTEPYRVTSLPDVHFDVGEFYSGSVPIDQKEPNRTLFFAFKPALHERSDEITIWLNGGPGCSSLEGFFQENGPWIWQPGTYLPVENPYTWSNLTNMLWVEQPVGTGFAQGEVRAKSMEDVAADFISFFKNWEKTFGIKNYKIYITGESFAGQYIPYIGSAMLNTNDTEHFNFSGAIVYDPVIQGDIAQIAPTMPYVNAFSNFLNLNQSFLNHLNNLHESCGYAEFYDKYMVFPPAGLQPSTPVDYDNCDVFDLAWNASLEVNNCFNIYAINQQCPLLWDVLGFPTSLVYSPTGAPPLYFNRSDVKQAMHAPQDVNWEVCASQSVLLDDTSLPTIVHAIPQMIEATNRVLIANGDYDMILITNGTLLGIQNMTWNGALGFQTAPSTPINITIPDMAWNAEFANPESYPQGVDGPQGIMGIQHYERGLMWSETFQSGHMEPEFQPRVTYRHLQWLLGQIDTL